MVTEEIRCITPELLGQTRFYLPSHTHAHTHTLAAESPERAAKGEQHAAFSLPPIELYSLGSAHQHISYSWQTFSPLQTRSGVADACHYYPRLAGSCLRVRQRRPNLINHVDQLCYKGANIWRRGGSGFPPHRRTAEPSGDEAHWEEWEERPLIEVMALQAWKQRSKQQKGDTFNQAGQISLMNI